METIATKICTLCGINKPRSEYFPRGDGTARIQAKCITCQRATGAAAAREWRKKNPNLARNSELKKKHGITLEDYEALLAEQGGACAVCHRPPGAVGTGNKSVGTLAVDHCHTTGTFRGLLCTNCNLGIGSFFESPKLLEDAAAYLRSHQDLVSRVLQQKNEQEKAKVDLVTSFLQDDL